MHISWFWYAESQLQYIGEGEAAVKLPMMHNLLQNSLNQRWFPRGKHPEEERLYMMTQLKWKSG